jgi:hypothetical protein
MRLVRMALVVRLQRQRTNHCRETCLWQRMQARCVAMRPMHSRRWRPSGESSTQRRCVRPTTYYVFAANKLLVVFTLSLSLLLAWILVSHRMIILSLSLFLRHRRMAAGRQCVGAESDARCDLLCALGRATDPHRLRRALDGALDEGARPSDATALLFQVWCIDMCHRDSSWNSSSFAIAWRIVCLLESLGIVFSFSLCVASDLLSVLPAFQVSHRTAVGAAVAWLFLRERWADVYERWGGTFQARTILVSDCPTMVHHFTFKQSFVSARAQIRLDSISDILFQEPMCRQYCSTPLHLRPPV